MKRLAVLHTVGFLVERFKTMLKERYPQLDSFHMLDESLLQDLLRQGESPNIVRRITTHAELARDAGAGLILFTCSSTSPAVDVARRVVDVPILKIDDPMMERAVQLGRRIGLVCTASSTQGPSTRLLAEHAERQGREINVRAELVGEAYKALMAGDHAGHDRLLMEAAQRLARECDVIVLAQASMAHLTGPLREALSVPVLSSPELCLEALGRWANA